ncbi:S8 family serine peptidase [Luteibacter aegosomatissinici]|uniref:S8 family serine peptidase n=1 Tax=Luteibacter aegosomatissinici TaxID=2911539 RepID=UPI001FF7755B|nr:S8 family serine peptidase [Luteibacter aegosomatissinici]UPG95168.1 S8 family serine peptidase [Luteibacter aegosomatissinici]
MKHRVLLLLATALALAGCAATRPSGAALTAPASAPASGDTSVAAGMDSSRDIVLAVSNPLEPAATHAGSSLLGYAPAPNYGAGQRARSLLSDLRRQYGWNEVGGWPIRALGVYCIVLRPPAGMDRDALIAALAKDQRVELAQPLQEYAVYSDQDEAHYNDPYTDLQRGFVETHAAEAHTVTQGDGVHVAVVDTGVDLSHPDLKGHIADTRDEVSDHDNAFATDRHGTEVAGIIAAVGNNHQGMVGMAPKAEVSVYKACWYADAKSGARCNSFTLAKALAAVNDTDARIINLSLGGPADPLLGKLLDQLLSQGRIVIAALPPNGDPRGFPDSAPGVIVVRTTATGPAPPGVVSAPGNDILTTQPGGGYDFTSGSSMATAHVSGIVALLLSVSPGLDARAVHDILLRTSAPTNGLVQVDAAAAVDAVPKKAIARR